MSKGENIFKRKDGRWEARYVRGRTADGKIRYGYCYAKTYREAKEKVTERKLALLSGAELAARERKKCFAHYCGEWLSVKKSSLKESTWEKYDRILTRHIQPAFGSLCPAQITSELVSSFTRRLLEEQGLSPKTVKDILAVLRAVLKYAARQIPGGLPYIEIVTPREVRQETRILTSREQLVFTGYLYRDMDACKFGILLALQTGLRLGEICALRWENISLSEQVICVHSTMQRLRNDGESGTPKTKIAISSPKSDTSFRMIPLTENTADLCRRMQCANPGAYVLTGTEHYMEPRTLQYRLQKYTAACGLEGIHFHTLRHTFATRCVEVGFEIKSLSEILGHASTTITLERYVHASMDLKRSNMQKLSAVGW